MDNHTLTRIIEILETDPDFFVPIKKLWLMLQGEGLALDTEPETLHRMLQEDERFEFAPGVDHKEGFAEIKQDMEMLGFYSGPRIKMASREMTADAIFAAMARRLEQMNAALQGAWDTRPEGDQDMEEQLLDILATGQKLEREIRNLGTD